MFLGDTMYKDIKIIGLDDFGRGICFIDNKITFVENALEGEVVDLEIINSKKKYQEAKVLKMKKKSKDRVNYDCPYYLSCGGCHIAHMAYEAQLTFKKKKVENILRRYTSYKNFSIHSILGSRDLYYRNKITLHIKKQQLGYYQKKTNQVIAIDHCLLVHPKINETIKKINQYLQKKPLHVKKIVIRCINEDLLLWMDQDVPQDFIDYMGNVNIVANGKTVLNHNFIEDHLLGNTFVIKENAFYQVNKKQVEKLYGLLIDHVKEKKYRNVLDLYCGTGTIGISISKYVQHVVGIECNSSSISSAQENKKRNHVLNIDFIEGKVEDQLEQVKGKFDLVIVDPPRSGLDKHSISIIKEIGPKAIVYVSCDPMTLARDIELLKDQYELKKMDLVDMFKNTYHVESVCVLNHK